MADSEAPEADAQEERLPAPGEPADDDDEDDAVLEVPADVPEADALEQGRQPAIPGGSRLPHLTDDPEVPEADALEQAETFAATADEDDGRSYDEADDYDR
jgi:hypothetical protein